MKEALLVAAGGAAGALFRYFIHLLFLRFHGSSLAATLLVNISGSFVLGFLIVAWDKLAETCHQYLRKGRKVHVEGRLQTRIYTGQEGIEKYATEIVLEELVMLDKMPEDVKEMLKAEDASNGTTTQ